MIGIDLGSNTLRAIQIECATGKRVAAFEKIVKTADGLVQTGMVSKETKERIVTALREAGKQIDFASDHCRAVATQAMRQAYNSNTILKSIREETGISFEIINSTEEAELTLLAVKHRMKLLQARERSAIKQQEESFLLIDIGGGSTELIFDYPEKVSSRSFAIGIVTLSQRYPALDEIKSALPKFTKSIQHYCDEVYAWHGKVQSFVATAGTPTTIAAMKLGQNYVTYDPEMINGTTLSMEDLDSALAQLLAMPPAEREVAVGVGRADLISAGILIFRQLFFIAGLEQCIVIDDGLREGVVLKACSDYRGE